MWNGILNRYGGERPNWGALAQALGEHFFKVPLDLVPQYDDEGHKWIRKRYFDSLWHEAYDLVEFVVLNVDYVCKPPGYSHVDRFYTDQRWRFVEEMNTILERELSGYRFVEGVLVPVSDPAEVLAIEEAASGSGRVGITGAFEHIRTSLELLGRKPSPDYRNSIKEAISAVEVVVNSIAGTDGNGVAGALDALEAKGIKIHGALDKSMRQLYGFTSDTDGVRHAIMSYPTVGYDEAKFMLVVCSGLVRLPNC